MSVKEAKKERELNNDEIEIRLDDVVQFLRDSRWVVFRWTSMFLIIGAIYAFTQQNEYTAIVKVMPELKSSSSVGGGLGDLKSLAGLAGVNIGNLNGTSEAIRPDLYPDIVQSVPFSLYLLKQSVTTSDDAKPQSLETYLNNKAANSFIGSINKLLGLGKSDEKIATPTSKVSTLRLTRQQETLNKEISGRVGADMDKKSGIITISSRMTDAVVTAIVARQTLDYLTNYVTNYRTGKARQQVKFLTNQVNNARQRYEAIEFQLSNYRDHNRSLSLNIAKIEEQRLQADYLLAQSVYGDLAKQLEQAKIKVEEEAPVFQILEPPRIPYKKSGPQRVLTIAGFSILGAVLGLAAFFIKRSISPKTN